MSGSVFDHLVAVLIIGAMFLGAVVALPNLSYPGLLSVDQQQLRNVALSAFDTILLDAGYPLTWGNVNFNSASVSRFGLASTGGDSGLFILDSDKVTRLVETDEWGRPNPIGYLRPDQARKLLGLQAYGFNLTIMAPFKVTARDLAPPANPLSLTAEDLKTIKYEVAVRLQDGKPIPNAAVSTFIVYSVRISGSSEEQYEVRILNENQTTDAVGNCRVVKSLTGEVSDVILVFKATVGDINTVTSFYRRGSPRNDIAEINMVGDDIILTTPPATPRDNRWVLDMLVYTEDNGLIQFYKGTDDSINWGSSSMWQKNFPGLNYLNPLLLIVNFRAVEKNSGRQGVLVVGPFPGYLGSRVLSYSTGTPSGETATLQRVVNIAGMTYTAEFTLWKQ